MAKLHPSLKNKPRRRTSSLRGREFWYKDITLIPNRLPDFERDEVDLTTNFTKKIVLKTPFVSSPMDTVTESKMAILMGLQGGIGVIHYNFSTIDEQIKEAEKVKRFMAGFVFNPIVFSPESAVRDVYDINERLNFFSVPITEDGTLNSKLVGIVTRRDVRYRKDMETKLKDVMTAREKLRVAKKSATVEKNNLNSAVEILRKNNLDTLPIVDEKDRVVALVTDSDIRKQEQFPLATVDENKRLRVFIAVEARLKLAEERIKKGFAVGADGILIDAGIVFREQLAIAKWAKKSFPKLEVVLGSVDSAEMVKELLKGSARYCDGLRVGIGPGAACITQQELGTGRAQASAVRDCAEAVKKLKRKYGTVPIIADGGIKIPDLADIQKPGDISKALALGAQTVMMGKLLAGLDEAPGEKEFDYEENKMVKKYRGMGSVEAMEKRGAVRYGIEKYKIKVPEGKVIKVPYRGSGYDFIPKLIAGVKQSLQKQGFRNIKELQKEADIRPI
ncbi:MAG: IMP dehydrogenase [Candidatus Nealsonbacteria bacterium CG08_land_8_20_14_0_20_38_20]|uniref:IMP dehydrogenase n=1 Tax=Candidatus Nealsonbacteria bacterium CG08_land_8_20_14_0_20_38_20 TaxID=1974705 RepID=A0A2H0YMJ4_9BACT|nr:MAG: IMP dehydrogenase [Candidatus Nealsonbacteria bacterium CG08_land_8_20_14_0_20_38_20]